MLLIAKILFHLWFLQFCESSLPPLTKTPSNLLANCVNKILTNTVNKHENVYLINTDLKINLPAITLNITNSLTKFYKIPPQPHAYVIETHSDFPYITHQLLFNGLLEPREELIILTDDSDLTDIFDTAETYFMHKFLIIQRQEVVHRAGNAPTALGSFDAGAFAFASMQPGKPRDFSVVYVPLPPFVYNGTRGVMSEIVNIIADKLEISVSYTASNLTNSETFVDDRGHAFGIISELEARRFDVVLSSLIRFSTESLYYDASEYIAADEVRFVVARSHAVDDWALFYKEFTWLVWILFIVSLLISYLVMYAIQRWWERSENSSLLVNIVQIILEGSSTIRSDSSSFNIIFISILLSTTIFTNVYKSRQFYFLRTDRSHQLINSADDAMRSELKSALHPTALRFYKNSIHPIEKYLLAADPYVCSESSACLEKVVREKDRVGVDVIRHLKHEITEKYIDSEGRSMMHFLEGTPEQDVYFVVFFLKGHPTFPRFQELLYSVRESGLSNYLDKKIDGYYEKAMALAQPSRSYRARALTLRTLRSTFYVYFSLVSISFVVCLLEITESLNSLDSCIYRILRSIDNKTIVYSINTEMNNINLPTILYDTSKSFTKVKKLANSPEFYIIKEDNNLASIINTLYFEGLFNPRSKFLIVTNEFNQSTIKILDEYFIYNAIILTIQRNFVKNNRNLTVINPSNCSGYKNIYPMEPRNITKLRILHTKFAPYALNSKKGVVPEILNLITANMKLKTSYIYENASLSSGYIEKNGRGTGMLGKLQTRRYDLSSRVFSPADREHLFFDITQYVSQDYVIYVVPAVVTINKWKMLYEEFSCHVWICFLCFLITFYIAFYLTSKHKQKFEMFIDVLRMLLQGSSPIPRTYNACKLLFLAFMVFVFVFTNLYKSVQFHFMIENLHTPLYRTEEDLRKYKLKASLHTSMSRRCNISTNHLENYLCNNILFTCNDNEVCLNQTAFVKNTASLEGLLHLKYVVPRRFIDSEGKSLLRVVENNKTPIFFYLYFLKGHPIFSRFNRKVRSVHEAGFIRHIIRQIDWNYDKAMASAAISTALEQTQLSLEMFHSTFFVYIILIFFTEMFPVLVNSAINLAKKLDLPRKLLTANFHNFNSLTSLTRPTLLQPITPSIVPACGFKIAGIVKRRCKSCVMVRTEERWLVLCKAKPRHKQMSMIKDPRNTWILSHATQSKVRPW
ncbi:unnamed protein product [Phyllotreta striolata]|uniref:39S ribosomal protein L36, mitochondrial n=1 Tax=Phyllotreta striolata TaxID=444603 RepID=A0A9N9XU04_PHYSR|nr:unnamed protein product [Phyllotreta striolata]